MTVEQRRLAFLYGAAVDGPLAMWSAPKISNEDARVMKGAAAAARLSFPDVDYLRLYETKIFRCTDDYIGPLGGGYEWVGVDMVTKPYWSAIGLGGETNMSIEQRRLS